MKSMFKTIAALAAILFAFAAAPALASTTCSTTVSLVATDTVATTGTAEHVYVKTAAGVGFDITTNLTGYSAILLIASSAYLTGSPVAVTFSASGVTCSTATYRTDLIQIYMGS